jgi:hypothetical protein
MEPKCECHPRCNCGASFGGGCPCKWNPGRLTVEYDAEQEHHVPR